MASERAELAKVLLQELENLKPRKEELHKLMKSFSGVSSKRMEFQNKVTKMRRDFEGLQGKVVSASGATAATTAAQLTDLRNDLLKWGSDHEELKNNISKFIVPANSSPPGSARQIIPWRTENAAAGSGAEMTSPAAATASPASPEITNAEIMAQQRAQIAALDPALDRLGVSVNIIREQSGILLTEIVDQRGLLDDLDRQAAGTLSRMQRTQAWMKEVFAKDRPKALMCVFVLLIVALVCIFVYVVAPG